jgi:hypothetical protein
MMGAGRGGVVRRRLVSILSDPIPREGVFKGRDVA